MVTAKRKPRDEVRQARNIVYRQHILAAAERVFADCGFESAKLQDISALAGLSMGTIYLIFPSKNDILRAILDERGREILHLARSSIAPEMRPLPALHALIETYIGYFVEHPDFLRMHLRQGTSWVLGPATGTETQIQHWKEIHALQADIFRRGVDDGAFVDEDPAYLAKMFSAMDQVLLADWVESGMKTGREELVQRLRETVTRAFHRDGH